MGSQLNSNKRDREKQKAAKRLEKQKRKEERQENSKGGAFQDMLAWVDENGNLCDTPPDPNRKKEEISLENIVISTPKQEEPEEPVLLRGRVEYFQAEKRFGFIKDRDSTEKYFFHISNAPDNIKEGDLVTFQTERGPKGMTAVNIVIVAK